MLFLENVLRINLTRFDDPLVKIPFKAYKDSASYDLFADETIKILSNSRASISTGLAMSILKGFYGQISPRSGLALRKGVVAFNTTIDSGYLGIVYVVLFNFSSEDFLVEKGNHIVQMIFKRCENVSFSIVDNLNFDSARGVKGFGSSGL